MKIIFSLIALFIIIECHAQTEKETKSGWKIRRSTDKSIDSIVGKWKDQNSTTTFFHGGIYSTKFNNGAKEVGRWRRSPNQLFFSANGTSIDDVYNIIYLSDNLMKTQLANKSDTTIWIATKILN